MRKLFLLFCCCLLVPCFVSGQTSSSQQRFRKDDFMYVMVYDYENNGVRDVKVFVNGDYEGSTNLQGRFMLPYKRSYKSGFDISLKKDGYEEIIQSVYFDPVQALYFKIGNAEQYLAIGKSFIDNGDCASALEYLDRSLSLDPSWNDTMFLKAVALNRLHRYGEALGVLGGIPLNSVNRECVEDFMKENMNAMLMENSRTGTSDSPGLVLDTEEDLKAFIQKKTSEADALYVEQKFKRAYEVYTQILGLKPYDAEIRFKRMKSLFLSNRQDSSNYELILEDCSFLSSIGFVNEEMNEIMAFISDGNEESR